MINFVCCCRIAYFAKGGGDAYLFDMQFPNVPKSVTRTHISVSNQKKFIAIYNSFSTVKSHKQCNFSDLIVFVIRRKRYPFL